jgi:hypothetical protein
MRFKPLGDGLATILADARAHPEKAHG